MSSLRLNLELAALRLPWRSGLVLAAVLLSALLQSWVLPALQDTLAHEASQPLPRPPSRPAPADPLAGFRASLLAPSQQQAFLQRLQQRAQEAGLSPSQIDYQAGADSAGGFRRLHIHLPLRGSYAALRQFCFALLADYPALALTSFDWQRSTIAETQLQAELHFVLLLKAQP